MHEVALAEGVMSIVEAAAARHAAARVHTVWLELGTLAHVEPEALRFCFAAVARGGVAAGATLEIERTPGAAWCMPCGGRVALARLGEACPTCGSYQLQVVQGEEMRVKEIGIG
jgi:hydrogenase nickel incorporation protein HypA/HybF